MKIEYYNNYGAALGSASFLGELTRLIADASIPNDAWHERTLIGVAPAGAVEARLVLQFLQPSNQAGAVHIDNVSFGITTSLVQAGDYDRDGVVDQSDYLVWRRSFASDFQLDADGNGDGVVDAADYSIWRKNVGAITGNSLLVVPEPCGLTLAIGGLLGLVGWQIRACMSTNSIQ
jgi:hypothetical protein